jgi:hypothetical protein
VPLATRVDAVSVAATELRIAPMTRAQAEVTADWRYGPTYDFYDADADHRDCAELLDPLQRDEPTGFVVTRTFVHETSGGFFPFFEMELPA